MECCLNDICMCAMGCISNLLRLFVYFLFRNLGIRCMLHVCLLFDKVGAMCIQREVALTMILLPRSPAPVKCLALNCFGLPVCGVCT